MKNKSPRFAQIDLSYLKELTKKMVRIPSPPGKEYEISNFIHTELRRVGIPSRLQFVEKNRSNVIARLRGKTQKTILFQGHIDTIPGYEWKDAFSGKEKDGRIYGRGSVDMKSSIACTIAAMKAIVERRLIPEKTILFAGTVDEETEKRGIYKLVEKGIRADMAVCCEPTDLKVGLGNKGNVPLRITTRGKATHGSTPEAGINAVYHMRNVLEVLEKNWKIKGKEIKGVGNVSGTYSVGIIRGGESYFVVPDWCHIWVDRRTIPGETKESVKSEVKKLLDSVKKERPAFQYEIALNERPDWKWPKIIERGYKSAVISPGEEIVKLASSAYRKVIHSDPETSFLMFWTEADFLINEARIPTIIFGPGEPGRAHSTEESVSLNQLYQAANIYLTMML